MAEYVVDTVALILRLEKRKMGARAEQVFTDAEAGRARIQVPAMVLAEILYLSQRGRISATLEDVRAYLRRYAECREYPLTFDVVETAARITDIPELHDRLIAATAVFLAAPLVTDDGKISESAFVRTVW